MLDCASIAAITALRHFRRPDVTVVGEDVTIVGPCFPHRAEMRADPLVLAAFDG